MPAYTADEIAGIRHTLANGSDQDKRTVLAHLDVVPVEHRPTLGSPPPATAPADAGPGEGRTFRIGGSFEDFQRLLEEDRQRQAAEQAANGTGGHAMAPATEPDPGSPEYQAADAEARRLDARAWEDLGFLGQVGVAFERFDQEGRQRGAIFNADSAARRLQTVLDLQRRQDAGEALNVTEKKYLLRNRTVASELAGAVGRLTEARQHLDSLPASDPLRRLFEASSVAEAAKLLREHPGAIARAIGVESLPALTASLIGMAVLGPVGGAVALTGTGGLDGYAKGLVGALARAGVDVSDADDLTRALQDKALMERVAKDATTDGAIEGGATALLSMVGGGGIGKGARSAARMLGAPSRASGGARVAAERGLWAPEEVLGAPGSLGAARVWTIKSRLKAYSLPTNGKIQFVPEKGYDPRVPLYRGRNKGFLEKIR
ncbi:MAG: hypothetical protein QM784_05605 [Polyangiaceae bacterium]